LQIDPFAYLKDVFERLPLCDQDDPESLNSLLPDRWLSEYPSTGFSRESMNRPKRPSENAPTENVAAKPSPAPVVEPADRTAYLNTHHLLETTP